MVTKLRCSDVNWLFVYLTVQLLHIIIFRTIRFIWMLFNVITELLAHDGW